MLTVFRLTNAADLQCSSVTSAELEGVPTGDIIQVEMHLSADFPNAVVDSNI